MRDDLARELDDQEVDTILQDHSTKAFEQTRKSLLLKSVLVLSSNRSFDHLEDSREAVSHSLIPGQDGHHRSASVQVVYDASRALGEGGQHLHQADLETCRCSLWSTVSRGKSKASAVR